MQRHSHRLPGGVRGWLRRFAADRPAVHDGAVLPGWAEPRITARASGPAPTPIDGSTDRAPAPTPLVVNGATDRLRCLLMCAPLDVGGLDEVVGFLARCLPGLGVETAVLQARDGEPLPPGRLAQQLGRAGIAVAEPGRAAAAAWIDGFAPDVVSVHGAADWAVELAHGKSIPCVETVHGMHMFFGEVFAEVAPRRHLLAGVVTVSELVRDQYLNVTEHWAPDTVVTIPNGTDQSRRIPPSREVARRWLGLEDEYLFVCLARHCLQKNTYGLTAAFEEVAAKHDNAHLVIAGRPDDRLYTAQVKKLRDGMRVRDQIHLRDHVADPAALLRAADAFVLDSFFEGWALASMEALCAGVPVVLADVGGAREQLGAGSPNGILVPNPLGDPLAVDWDAMSAARFQEQVNRADIVDGMHSVVAARDEWARRGPAIAAESARRFRPEVMLARHAHVLRAAADRSPITLPGDLAVR